ncbi:MAG: transposase [Sandaracinaceae bacterium]|nr:transposase [Sandaracinaceae bacterium]
MPRTPRHAHVLPGLPHHVVLRGNNRRNLFSSPGDRAHFVGLCLRSVHLVGCLVHALALMTNHVHLVLTPVSVEVLSLWVKDVSQRYALRRNRQRNASGKLFEQRYDALPIESERQLAATVPYVDLNPTRIGRANVWTTYALHSGEGACPELVRELWTPSSWWLGLGADEASRQQRYRELVQLRRESWEADVVKAPRRVIPVGYEQRPTRPDASRVAEPGVAYESLDLPVRGVASKCP